MADQSGAGNIESTNPTDSKGKGKAVETTTQEVSMEGEDSSSEEEVDEVRYC